MYLPMFLTSLTSLFWLFPRLVDALDASIAENADLVCSDDAPPPIHPTLDPKVDYFDLWDHFECKSYFDSPDRPTNHEPIWRIAQHAYHNLTNPSGSSLEKEQRFPKTSLRIPYSIRPAGHKGLGLFAEEDIPKGAIITDYRQKTRATFESGDLFRQYIHSISDTREVACLVLQCSEIEALGTHYEDVITSYLDDACLVNHDYEEPNMGGSNDDFLHLGDYAFHDIQAGEEITCLYGHYQMGWDDFSL